MISFARPLSLLGVFAIASLLGLGCSKPNSIPDAPSNTTGATTTPSGTNATSTLGNSSVDLTGWQTYKNSVLKFQFQYPVHGKFAPEFSVKLFPLNSSQVKNDCYNEKVPSAETPESLVVNGIAFCRTHVLETVAERIIDHEYWVTNLEKWHSVIEFTKSYPANQPFDRNGYKKQVEDIMNTFHIPTN